MNEVTVWKPQNKLEVEICFVEEKVKWPHPARVIVH